MKDLLEGAAKVWDVGQKIKAFCASLALISLGVFLYLDPLGKASELPYHEAIAIGCGAFGLLFLLALVTGGALQARLKSLLLILVATGVLIAISWFGGPQVSNAYALADHGATIEATVVSAPAFLPPRSGNYRTTVRHPRGGATIDLKHRVQNGARVTVRYLPEETTVAVPAAAGTTTWSILTWKQGSGGVLALLGIAFVALVSIPFNLSGLVRGTAPE